MSPSAGHALRGEDRVVQEHGDGHLTDAAGHRRDVRGFFLHALEVHVADDAAIGQAIEPDVDHDRTGAHHLRHDQIRHPCSDDKDVG